MYCLNALRVYSLFSLFNLEITYQTKYLHSNKYSFMEIFKLLVLQHSLRKQ